MKILLPALLIMMTGLSAHADSLSQFKCVSATNAGTVVTVKGCFQLPDDGDLSASKILGCKKGAQAVVGIQAKTKAGQISQQFLQGNAVHLQGIESFQILTNNPGKFELYVASDAYNSGFNKLTIQLPGMNYSFKAIGCEFTYLSDIK